jgi:hypothetical protein
MRFAWLVVLSCACGGKMLVDADAGDAATTKDAAADGVVGSDGGDFACGESGHFVFCDSTIEYCQLVKTAHARAYSCQPNTPAPTCAPVVSSPYECGCYTNGDEVFITICN